VKLANGMMIAVRLDQSFAPAVVSPRADLERRDQRETENDAANAWSIICVRLLRGHLR
jgi:hypothetical protein